MVEGGGPLLHRQAAPPTSARRFAKYLIAANRVLAESTLSLATQELVTVRASQINGCAGCLDMHVKEAVAAWRDANVFTEAERAAPELAEHGTRLADAGDVSDEVWAGAAEHDDDEQLLALVCVIALINTFNRLNVITRQVGGDYRPGQHG